jgi:hypothetical protein
MALHLKEFSKWMYKVESKPNHKILQEATMSKNIHEVVPPNRIKGILDIKLEEKARRFGLVELLGKISHINVVTMNASLFDKKHSVHWI